MRQSIASPLKVLILSAVIAALPGTAAAQAAVASQGGRPAVTSACDSACNPVHCFPAGPFTVTVVNVDHTLNSYHIIRLNLQFRNVGDRAISLAYHGRTSKAVDNLGNAYNSKDDGATGIPTDFGTNTDPRFTLQPGEARVATFELVGYKTAKEPTSFDYNLTIDELGNDKPAPVLREHAVFFRDVTPAMPGQGMRLGIPKK